MKVVIFLLSVLACLSASVARAEDLTVSAAISLKESMESIGTAYEKQTGDHVKFNFDASGKLAEQIRQGAPVDAFISADNEQVDKLIKSGDADEKTKMLVVKNTLVLITPPGAASSVDTFQSLGKGDFKIAIGDPKTVPAGRYAQQVFKALKLTDAVQPRLVLAENVRQVLTYVERGEVAAGVVYKTDATEAGDKVKTVATADESSHDAIEYPAVVIKQSKHIEAAGKFVAFLKTKAARDVFEQRGFTLPDDQPATRPSK